MQQLASARGGEVMARQSGAVLRVLAARSPRGCAQHRGSQLWAGGVPGSRLSQQASPPPVAGSGPGGKGAGGGKGGGRLAVEVLVVLVDVEFLAHVEVASLGLRTIAIPRRVPWGRRLHREERLQGRDEAGRRRARRERQQWAVPERLEGKAREPRPTG